VPVEITVQLLKKGM
jgi:UMP-CMP kinase